MGKNSRTLGQIAKNLQFSVLEVCKNTLEKQLSWKMKVFLGSGNGLDNLSKSHHDVFLCFFYDTVKVWIEYFPYVQNVENVGILILMFYSSFIL